MIGSLSGFCWEGVLDEGSRVEVLESACGVVTLGSRLAEAGEKPQHRPLTIGNIS